MPQEILQRRRTGPAERRDLVAGCFFLLTILTYLRAQQAARRERPVPNHLGFEALALSKQYQGRPRRPRSSTKSRSTAINASLTFCNFATARG